jgi:hypothetical protein
MSLVSVMSIQVDTTSAEVMSCLHLSTVMALLGRSIALGPIHACAMCIHLLASEGDLNGRCRGIVSCVGGWEQLPLRWIHVEAEWTVRCEFSSEILSRTACCVNLYWSS